MAFTQSMQDFLGKTSATPTDTSTPPPSTAEKVGGFFKGVGGFVKSLGETVVTGVKDAAVLAKTAAVGGFDVKHLNDQTAKQEASRKALNDAMNNISRLPMDQRKSAYAKLGTFDHAIQNSTIEHADKMLTEFGVTDQSSPLDIVKKGLEKTVNAEFAGSALLGPAEGLLNTGKIVVMKVADAIAGNAVRVTVRTGIDAAANIAIKEGAGATVATMKKVLSEAAAETLLKQAGSDGITTTIRYGEKVAAETFAGNAKKVLFHMARGAIINSSASLVSDWANGNNLDTPEARHQALVDAGMGALVGAGIEGGIGGTGLLIDLKTAPKQIIAISRGIDHSVGAIVRQQALDSLVINKSSQGIDEIKAGMKDIGEKGRAKQAVNRETRLAQQLKDRVSKTPNPFGSIDEQTNHTKTTYGTDYQPKQPTVGSGITKTKDGYKITYKNGDLKDFQEQRGKVTTPILADQGITDIHFKSELDSVPNSGAGSKSDQIKEKMNNIFIGVSNGNEAMRAKYPSMAAAYDSIHGVVIKQNISESIKTWAKTSDKIGPDLYYELDQFANEQSRTNVPNEINGNLTETTSKERYDQVWKEIYNIAEGSGSKDKATQEFNKLLTDNKYINDLRDTANQIDPSPGKNLFTAVDRASNAITKEMPIYDKDGLPVLDPKTGQVKSLSVVDQKIKLWRDHFSTFHPDVAMPDRNSPLDVNAPKLMVDEPTAKPGTDSTSPSEKTMSPSTSPSEPVPVGSESLETRPTGSETATSKLARGVEEKAIANKLTSKLGDLPEYTKVNMQDQARAAAEILAKNEDQAIRIATGIEEPPTGVLPESVFVAVENKATADGNIDLLRKLAKSDLTTGASVMGQRIRVLAERDPFSPVSAIKSVSDERAKSFESKNKTTIDKAINDTVAEMEKKIPKVKLDKSKINTFIDDITCK